MQSLLKISEAASIALHSMVYLATNNNKLASTKEISMQLQVSENHLSKVLQRLVKAELIKSIKGPKGGFKLLKDTESITLLEVYESIDGPLKQGHCLFGKQICERKTCIMDDLIQNINAQVRDYLENKKLSDFISEKNLNNEQTDKLD